MDRKQQDGTGNGNNNSHYFQDPYEDMDVEIIDELEDDHRQEKSSNQPSTRASSYSLKSSTTNPPRATSPCSASMSPNTALPKILASATSNSSQGVIGHRCVGCGAEKAKGSSFFAVDKQAEDGVERGWCFSCTISGLNTGRADQASINNQPSERANQEAVAVEFGRQVVTSIKKKKKKRKKKKQTEQDPNAKNVVTEISKTPTEPTHAQDVVSSWEEPPSEPISSSATTSLDCGLKAKVKSSKTCESSLHIPSTLLLNPQLAYLDQDMDVEIINELEDDHRQEKSSNQPSMHTSSYSLKSSTTNPPRATSPCSASMFPNTALPKIPASATSSSSQGVIGQRCVGCGAEKAKGSSFFAVDKQAEDGVERGWCFSCTISGLNTERADQASINNQPSERANQEAVDVEFVRQVVTSSKQKKKKKQTEQDLDDAKNVVTEISKKRTRPDTTPTEPAHAQDVVSSCREPPSEPISSSARTSLGFGLKAKVKNSKTLESTLHISNPQSTYLDQDNPVLLHPPKAPVLPSTFMSTSTKAKRSRRNPNEIQVIQLITIGVVVTRSSDILEAAELAGSLRFSDINQLTSTGPNLFSLGTHEWLECNDKLVLDGQASTTNMVATRAKYQIIHHHGIESIETIGTGKGGSTAGGTVPSVAGAASGRDAPAWRATPKSNPFGFFSQVGNANKNFKAMGSLPQFHKGTSSAPKRTFMGRVGSVMRSCDSRKMKAVAGAKSGDTWKTEGVPGMKSGDTRNINPKPGLMSGDAKIKSATSSPLLVVIDGSNVAFGFDEVISKPRWSLKGILLALQYFEERGVDVVALVPRYRINSIRPQHDDYAALVSVMSRGLVSVVPLKTNDDLFILSYAVPRRAYVVTNDQFRDHQRTPSTLVSLGLERHELEKYLANQLVPYTFVRGEFTPNPTSPIIKELTGRGRANSYHMTSLGTEFGGSGLNAQASTGDAGASSSEVALEISPEGTDANPIVISPGPS